MNKLFLPLFLIAHIYFVANVNAQGYLDLSAYQRGADMANQQRYQEQMMQQQYMMQQQMINQQRELEMQRRALEAQRAMMQQENAPEWQQLNFVRQEPNAKLRESNVCVYGNKSGFFYVRESRYGFYKFPLESGKRCPPSIYVSRISSAVTATKPL